MNNNSQLIYIIEERKNVNDRQRKDLFAICHNERKVIVKKLSLISIVLAGVTFGIVGCASEAGLNALGNVQTSANSVGVQGNVGADVDTSTQVQPNQVDGSASAVVSGDASAQ